MNPMSDLAAGLLIADGTSVQVLVDLGAEAVVTT